MRTIKRYSNRKLYDTEDKRYITLEQIAVLVRDHHDIKVVDNQTGEDLTTVTLSQILLEQEKRKETSLPKSFLTNLIQRSVDFTKRNVLHLFDHSFASEQEVSANVDKMVESGEVSHDEGKKLKDELISRTLSFKKKIDELVERSVHEVLGRLNIPTKIDVQKLHDRLDEVTRKFEALLKEQQSHAPKGEPATKSGASS